ncbi:MAG TPA: enoyl-CoA hydratase/isomerase family protein [Candidatus Limnocylindria bacterium]|nr:enoyl-CoA hydratase/isomerase family protein [Candidatus Limnocylindria bacterium]
MPSVRLDLDGPVARVTLNRPEVLNAGDPAWVVELTDVVARIGANRDLRVAVITGAGRAFSTGVDLGSLAAGEMTLPRFVAWEDAMTAIEHMRLPFIAAINGHCLGGGLQLALVCDYRLASEDAVIGLPAVKECLIPSMALYRLPRLIGAARAREMILTGEPISAVRAEQVGLVSRVVPAPEFPRALDDCIEGFLALPVTSVGVSKRLLARAFDLPFDAFRREMEAGFRLCLDSAEHRAAMDEIRRRRKGPAR